MDYDYVRMRRSNQEENLMGGMGGGNSAPERYQRFSQDIYETPANLPSETRARRNAPPAPIISSVAPARDRGYDLQTRYPVSSVSYDPACPLDDQAAPPQLFKTTQFQGHTTPQNARYSQSGQRQDTTQEERPPRFDPYGQTSRSSDVHYRPELEVRRESRTVEHYSLDRSSLDSRLGNSNRNELLQNKSYPSQESGFVSRSGISNQEGATWRSDSGRIVLEDTSWKEPGRRENQIMETSSNLGRSTNYRLDIGDDELDRFLEAHLQKGPKVSEFTRPARTGRDEFEDQAKITWERSADSYYRGRSAGNASDTYSRPGRTLELNDEFTQAKETDWQLPSSARQEYGGSMESSRQFENVIAHGSGSSSAKATSIEPTGTVATFRRKVTHVDGQIGFAGTDLFFQMSKVVGSLDPQLGSWIVVKAEKVQSMPFEWNALSVEVEKQLSIESDLRSRQYPSAEQIPLILPSQNYSVNQPLKSILKNKPPPPPQISSGRSATSQRQQPRPPSPRSGGNFRNRSPSPESPLILFENIIPEKRRKVSPVQHMQTHLTLDRQSRNANAVDRGKEISKSPSRRSRISPGRSARRGSRSPRRLSRSPRRSPRRSSRSPRKSPRRSSRSPRRSPRRRSRSPRRLHRRSSRSRSPRRSPKRDSRSPRRSPRRSSRSPRRSPRRRLSRSPKRSPRRISRSPLRLSREGSPTLKTKKANIPSLLTLNPITEPHNPKKPTPVSFTWTKSVKDPNQPATKTSPTKGKKVKAKQAEQLPAFRLVQPDVSETKKQSVTAQPDSGVDMQQIKKTAQNIRVIKENLQKEKKAKSNVKTIAPNLTSIPLLPIPNPIPVLPIPNQPAYYSNPTYPPNFGQTLPQTSYYPGSSYSMGPTSYPPQSYVPNQQYNYSNQYQQSVPFYGEYNQSQIQYTQSLPQNPSMGQTMQPAGEKLPSQILRTTMGPINTSRTSSDQSAKKTPCIEKAPILVKNPFHKEPLPPGTEGGQTSSETSKQDQAALRKDIDIVKPTVDPLPPGTSQNQLDDLSDDEICTIYVKPASVLFEDTSETEITPDVIPSKILPPRPSKSPSPKNSFQLNQQDLQTVSDEDHETHDVMTSTTAIELGCHPDRVAEARDWMICVRCAQRGHLHDMCDKDRVPRALPFEISMAKALLKDSKKKHFENSKKSDSSHNQPSTVGQTSEKQTPGSSKTGGNGKDVVVENITLWEQERQRLKQKTNSQGSVVPEGSKPNVKGSVVKGQSKAEDSREKVSKSPAKPQPKQLPVKKVSPQKANLPADSIKSLGPKNPSEPKNISGGIKSTPTQSSKKSSSTSKLSDKLTQKRKELIESREKLDHLPGAKNKRKKVESSNRTRSIERYSSHSRQDDNVVRINRRRSLSPRERPQVFNDPMKAMAVKQLEIKSLELRDLELQQKMKLLLAEQQRMGMSRHPHPDPPRLYDGHDHGGHPSSRVNHFCYVCLGTGHRAQDCQESCPSWVRNKMRVPEGFVIEKSRGLLEPFCLSCGKVGHFTRECRYRNNFGEYSDDD